MGETRIGMANCYFMVAFIGCSFFTTNCYTLTFKGRDVIWFITNHLLIGEKIDERVLQYRHMGDLSLNANVKMCWSVHYMEYFQIIWHVTYSNNRQDQHCTRLSITWISQLLLITMLCLAMLVFLILGLHLVECSITIARHTDTVCSAGITQLKLRWGRVDQRKLLTVCTALFVLGVVA